MVQQRYGRQTEKMREHDARNAEMAEKSERIAVGARYGIVPPLPHIAVRGEHAVQPLADSRILLRHVAFADKGHALPAFGGIQSGILLQKRGKKIPKNMLFAQMCIRDRRKRVVLPPPDEPMMASTSPFCSVKEMPLSTSFSPKRLR